MRKISAKYPGKVTFRIVENLTYSSALEVYKNADIFIDQLLIGWYGGFAVEGMAYGKPVVSYIRQEDLDVVPPEMRAQIPVVNATARTLFQVMDDLLRDKEQIRSIGLKGRSYVERWHNPSTIAYQMKACYESLTGTS